ncbi:MAG: putative hydro-lyase [Azospirillum sp.]|nr:putative hydro-lyase [Azospirillum sp.]
MVHPSVIDLKSAQAARKSIRTGQITGQTSGLAPGFVQGNIVILTVDWANDFLQFCLANPKPCPLLAVGHAGDPHLPNLGSDLDIRTDVPSYRVFRDGAVVEECHDIGRYWRDDFVTFVLGCSFSFEAELLRAGVPVRHVEQQVNVPMFRTSIDCTPAGRFSGKLVVSMRPLATADAIKAIEVTSRFPQVHGAPVHFGSPAAIGIDDVRRPDFGDGVTVASDEIPVFWACGVTPQVALERAKPPLAITHSPGCMLITDISDDDLATGRFVFVPPADRLGTIAATMV